MSDTDVQFLVNRDDFRDCRIVEQAAPGEPAAGDVVFRIDRAAFTANNISYAAAGVMLRYWDFFPTMGFADVIASKHPKVAVGTRCFGFYPMGRYLTITPGDVSPGSIVDAAPHRDGIAAVYNTYNPVTGDPTYSAPHEDQQMLLRGLFMTSFLVDDFLDESDYFGAKTLVIASASSKTAIALAHVASRASRARVVGLTSARNRSFVEGLGCYDDVVDYEDIDRLPSDAPAVFVDMAGNAGVVARIHGHFDAQLRHSCTVGATHWESGGRNEDLPGPKPEFFFAPGQIAKRIKDWGPAGFGERVGTAWVDFRDSSDAWLRIRRNVGAKAVEQVYLDTLEGRTSPADGNVISL